MGKFEQNMREVTVPVRPDCLVCPAFKGMISEPERYDADSTPNDIATMVLRVCVGRQPNLTQVSDDEPLAYLQPVLPTCGGGRAKTKADTKRILEDHGVDPSWLMVD